MKQMLISVRLMNKLLENRLLRVYYRTQKDGTIRYTLKSLVGKRIGHRKKKDIDVLRDRINASLALFEKMRPLLEEGIDIDVAGLLSESQKISKDLRERFEKILSSIKKNSLDIRKYQDSLINSRVMLDLIDENTSHKMAGIICSDILETSDKLFEALGNSMTFIEEFKELMKGMRKDLE